MGRQYSSWVAKKRRTKKQKVVARSRALTYSLSGKVGLISKKSVTTKSKKKTKINKNKQGKKMLNNGESLFGYDPGLIRGDLTKTVLLSILAVATIVVIKLFGII